MLACLLLKDILAAHGFWLFFHQSLSLAKHILKGGKPCARQ